MMILTLDGPISSTQKKNSPLNLFNFVKTLSIEFDKVYASFMFCTQKFNIFYWESCDSYHRFKNLVIKAGLCHLLR